MAKGISVLLIDRPGAMRKDLRERLQRLRTVEVREAQDGTEAFDLLAVSPVHAIFASVSAQPMGGIDLVRRIRSGQTPGFYRGHEPPRADTPVYLFGERLSDEMVRSCLDAGANGAYPTAVMPSRITTILRSVVRDMLNANTDQDRLVVRTQTVDPCVIYHFFGSMIHANGDALTDIFTRIVQQTQRFVGLEITRVAEVNEYTLGTLVLMNGVAERAQKKLNVICEVPEKAEVFRSMNVSVVLPIYPSVMDFVTACRVSQAQSAA